MIYVYLDSSMSYLCVGISDDKKLIDYISYEAWQKQSENLIPELNNLLTKHGYNKDDISRVYVTIGPGSYTGTRIALTTAKIMYAALKCDVYPISTLNSLKDGEKPSICLLDARSSRSYIGVYKDNECLLADTIYTNDEVNNYINEHKDYVVRGKLNYLGLKDNESDVIKEMFSLKDKVNKSEHPLAIKPAYLKE